MNNLQDQLVHARRRFEKRLALALVLRLRRHQVFDWVDVAHLRDDFFNKLVEKLAIEDWELDSFDAKRVSVWHLWRVLQEQESNSLPDPLWLLPALESKNATERIWHCLVEQMGFAETQIRTVVNFTELRHEVALAWASQTAILGFVMPSQGLDHEELFQETLSQAWQETRREIIVIKEG